MSRKNDGRPTTKDYEGYSIDARVWRKRNMPHLLMPDAYISYTNKKSKSRSEFIDLSWTPCNFGGWRVWFICPRCQSQVAIIYYTHDLKCRRCYNLKYASQNMSNYDRGIRLINKSRSKLGWPAGYANGEYGRPKRMHKNTYCRLYIKYSLAIKKTLGGPSIFQSQRNKALKMFNKISL